MYVLDFNTAEAIASLRALGAAAEATRRKRRRITIRRHTR